MKKLIKKITCNFTSLWNHPKIHIFYINILLGIIISIILHFIGTTQFVEDILNPMIDKLIKNESDKIINLNIECHRGNIKACKVIDKSLSENIIFFDIDNKNYLQWGEPILTPRDKLANAIAIAAKKKAKVIVLDILLYKQACDSGEDSKLIEVLKSLAQKGTTIIFSVSLSQEKQIKESQIMKLDNLIDETPYFYRGLPLILASQDGVVRYFRGYQVVNDKKTGKESVLWGIPVLAVALYKDHLSELKELDEKILDKKYNSETLALNLSEKKLYITSDNIYTNRLRFFMRPPELYEKEKQGNLSLFQRRTFDILQNEDIYSPDDLAEKIVIIGNSSISQGDIFMTSVGYMPGMYVIGNTINTLLHDNLQIIPSQELDFFIMLIFIILISLPITFIDNFESMVYSLMNVCILSIPFVIEFIFDKLTVYTFAERSIFLKMLLITFIMVIINQQVLFLKSFINSFQKLINYIKEKTMKNIVNTFLLCFIIVISFSQSFAKGSVVGVIMEGSYSSNCKITHNASQVSCKQYKGLSVGDVIEDSPSIDRLKFRLGSHVKMKKLSPTQVKVVYASVSQDDKNILVRTKDFLKKFLEPVKLNDFYGSSRGRDLSSEEKKRCHLILQEEVYLNEPYSIVLYHSSKPLTFIWDYDFSALVFKDAQGKEILRENIRGKESIQILPEKAGLKEGQLYAWYYEYDGKPEEIHPLKVLDKKTEKEILDNLTEIDRQQLSSLENIFQKAAYLQLLSDTREDVDLYWLSYALLPKDVTSLKEEEKLMVCKLKYRYIEYLKNNTL